MVGMNSVDKKRLKLGAPPPWPTHTSGQSVGVKSLPLRCLIKSHHDQFGDFTMRDEIVGREAAVWEKL